MARRMVTALSLFTAGLVLGCGGGATPPAEAPEDAPPPPTQAKPASPPETAETDAEATEASKSDEGEAEKSEEGEDTNAFQLDRPPREIVTAEDTSFELNYTASEVGERDEKRCEEESGGDPKTNADCKREARKKVPTWVQRFVEKRKVWYWVTYERRGKQLITLHKIPFEFGEDTANTVTIKPTGKDKGLAPFSPVPRKVVITIPNSYSIQMDDPKFGKLRYSAKIGLTPSKKK
jgi:hypothetical protein